MTPINTKVEGLFFGGSVEIAGFLVLISHKKSFAENIKINGNKISISGTKIIASKPQIG